VNGFKPARLGMITPDPVVALEARRYRDADVDEETVASKKPGIQRPTVEPDIKSSKAMNAIRTLRAAAAAIK